MNGLTGLGYTCCIVRKARVNGLGVSWYLFVILNKIVTHVCMYVYFEWRVSNINTAENLLETPCKWWTRTDLAIISRAMLQQQ
jgi:hypothetical protein